MPDASGDPAPAPTPRMASGAPGPDAEGVDRLFPLVYDELRAQAQHHFRRQPANHTLQPTAVVHEVFLKLAGRADADFRGETHFKAVAALAMRHVLVDGARKRRTDRRGGGVGHVTIDEALIPERDDRDMDVLALDDALAKLEQWDARKARVVSLRFFGGLTLDETAETMDLARSTVAEDWRLARAWLLCELRGENEEEFS